MRIAPSIVLSFLMVLATSIGAEAAPDWTAVGQALGKAGSVMPGGIYCGGLPGHALPGREPLLAVRRADRRGGDRHAVSRPSRPHRFDARSAPVPRLLRPAEG